MTPILRAARSLLTKRGAIVVLGGAAMLAVVVPVGLGAQQAVPSNTAQPTITGSPAQGQTLTGTQGTWANDPTSYSYQWVRCGTDGGAADGSDCAVIGGATTTAYVVGAGDVGFRLRLRVTASNSDGPNTAASNATNVVTAQQGPPNTQPPTITGQAVVDQTLTANPGTWTGTGITYTYAWSRCDTAGANCTAITGATATTYKLVDSDSGHTIRVKVTAKNASGENSVTSAQTAVVTGGAAPPTSGCPAGTGPINVANLAPPARLSIGGQRITPAVVNRDTTVIRLSFRITACQGRSVVGALVYATPTPYQQFSATEQPTGADGRAVLTMRQLRYFPASNQQQLLVVFVRARKGGEDVLGGVSSRRLVSFKVNLRG
jgi:hypothetical protein